MRTLDEAVMHPACAIMFIFAGLAAGGLLLWLATRARPEDFYALKPAFYPYSWLYGAGGVPFRALVAHIVYYGPLVFLAIAVWPAVARKGAALGPGAALAVLLAPLLALNPETRQLPFTMVVVVTLTVLYVAEKERGAWVAAAICIASLLYAKPWWAYFAPALKKGDAFLTWPFQAYFKHMGPWMTPSSMLDHTAWLMPVFVLALAWRHLRRA